MSGMILQSGLRGLRGMVNVYSDNAIEAKTPYSFGFNSNRKAKAQADSEALFRYTQHYPSPHFMLESPTRSAERFISHVCDDTRVNEITVAPIIPLRALAIHQRRGVTHSRPETSAADVLLPRISLDIEYLFPCRKRVVVQRLKSPL
jgi:hypothetical protein